MSNQGKLKKLLKIAVENGYDINQLPSHFALWVNDVDSEHLKENGKLNIKIIDDTILVLGTLPYSLIHLIGSCRRDIVSFMRSLIYAVDNDKLIAVSSFLIANYTLEDSLILEFMYKYDNDKLSWLFDTFKVLIDE